jgi:phenylalanyl-tRNA synthetase alpha chain
MLSSYRNFIPQESCKIPSTFQVSVAFVPQNVNLITLTDPSVSLRPPEAYYKRVAEVHEKGGYDSIGYRTPWSDEESHKLLLRTHTTASSAAMLYKLAAKCRGEEIDDEDGILKSSTGGTLSVGDDGFRPAKLFSIDRVFRNETMDATHLAEFHQVEGVVADRNLTLADLIGKLLSGLSSVCLEGR